MALKRITLTLGERYILALALRKVPKADLATARQVREIKRRLDLRQAVKTLDKLNEQSDEFGPQSGMAILSGRVTKFPEGIQDPDSGERYPIPHMGWNTVELKKEIPLFKGIETGSYFYFVHSYYPIPEDPKDIAATTPYGIEFVCAVQRDNIHAVQFHPEKSQEVGLRLLTNFGELKG